MAGRHTLSLQETFVSLMEFIFALILWGVILVCIAIPSMPIWLPLIGIRRLEQWIYEEKLGMERVETDAVLWLLDSPKNKGNINGIMMMHERFEVERFQQIIRSKMVDVTNADGQKRYPNASKYIQEGFFNYYWAEEKNFDINNHVYVWNDKLYRSTEEMVDALGKISSRTFFHDKSLSPWEYIFLRFLDNGVEKTCILVRCHHALADGVSYINFVVNMLSDEAIEQISFRTVPKYYQMFMKAKGLFYGPFTLLKTLLSEIPNHGLHCRRVSGVKELLWSKPISLSLIKTIKTKLQVTVNDVAVGCLATHLNQYLRNNNEYTPLEMRTAFPFNTRYSLSEAEALSNKFGNVFVSLPVQSPDPVQNIMELSKRMNVLKYSGEHHGMSYMAGLMNFFFPLTLSKMVFDALSSFPSMVISNVPGPQKPLKLDGSSVEIMSAWPPSWQNIGMSMSIISYNGEVRIGLCCDSAMKIRPNDLLKGLPDIFQSLAQTVQVVDLHDSE